MFGELERILRLAGLDLDDEDVLDALWLSRRLPQGAGTPLARMVPDLPGTAAADTMPETAPAPSTGAHDPGTDGVPRSSDIPGTSTAPPGSGTASQGLAAVVGAPSSVAATGRDGLLLPGAKVLGSELALGRALRPLKRRVPSAFRTELDEEATAAAKADTKIANVVLRALPERWLRLALVIDSDVSMVLWERHCRELQTALERSAAFRQIEVHQLCYGAAPRDPASKKRDVLLVRPWCGNRTNALPTTALNDASGRTLILVITDGAAPSWRDGRMRAELEQWAKAGPTAVVHVLPRHLWEGTGVTADTWHITAPRPGCPNTAWRVSDPLLPPSVSSFDGVPVPVVELTPSGLRAWATAITTVSRPVPLPLWEPRAPDLPRSAGTAPRPSAQAFVRTASPSAVRLAAHLAAVAPVTVPVMHLVQSCLPKTAGTTALAEIFLGGLLRPVARPGRTRPEGPMKHRLFDFTAETKDLLLDMVPLRELIASSCRVGERIEQLVGSSPDFPAWLMPTLLGAEQGGEPHPFARIGASLLARLGYDDGEDLTEDDGEEDAAESEEPSTPVSTAVVFTALAVEYAAVRSHLVDREELVHQRGTRVERGRLDGTEWTVAIVDMGASTPFSADLTEQIITWLRPQTALFVGLAGSLNDDIQTGDVVVGTKLYAIHGGTKTSDGFLGGPEAWRPSPALEQAVRSAVRDMPDLCVHFKPIAMGHVAPTGRQSEMTRFIHQHYNDAVAIETEDSRMVQVAYLNGQLDALVVCGISDLVDAREHWASPEPAAARAAAVAMAVLRRYRPAPDASGFRTGREAETDVRGGEFRGPVMGKIEQREAPYPSAVAPAALPPTTAGFAGRGAELAQLLDALDPHGRGSGDVTATVISGLAGVGKTSLAVQAAHSASVIGWFPGGMFFVDLHGYDDAPVTADQALQALLLALGAAPEHIPATTDERAALYRSMLAERAAEHGRVLILADNASSSEQVRPLLTGSGAHHFLVTSRHRLVPLKARIVPLEQLTPRDSQDLLDLALKIADPSDSRIEDDAEAARKLAQLCGHLPLALQIAAALLVEDPGMPVTEFVGQLAASRDRLDHLDDGVRSVRAAFDLSYRRLPRADAHLLGLLALAPGPDVSDQVIAALVGAERPPTPSMTSLVRAHLVERGSDGERWRVHDLVREFGSGVMAKDPSLREEGAAARERVLDFYHRWANAADARLRWLSGSPQPELFENRAQALAWLDGERAGLVAAVQWAREERYARTAVALAACLAQYLSWRRYFAEWITVSTIARDAAQRAGDTLAEAIACSNLGSALQEAGRVEEAIDALTRARDLQQAAGNRAGEATAWSNLGNALRLAGRVEDAIDALSRARDIHQAVDDLQGEALALNNLGLALNAWNRTDDAMTSLIRARDVYTATGDRHGQGVTWHNLGLAMYTTGRLEEAVHAYDEALGVFREFEDWYAAGRALDDLAATHMAAGDSARARDALLRAADAYDRAAALPEAAQSRARAEELA
ncbi:SAV_2336 N-terminal domain-related protein [Streptomyces sp. S.PNR 29]|uniref:SAV_2336 N-terminal domain-related protein n=1 Tax=Streptomyces sp. S.PNR 29 TaxID=2973805 RepID=UPI0025B10C3B|nr:SAV_2336 N-terminal domain-related protein [Streptomyces sp. S.PNR 29]MDN0199159.1 tetratricopeptide repeat protein [Streptomyces sp. S.PNR 29]